MLTNQTSSRLYQKFLQFILLLSMFALSSCSLLGEKPDKLIEANFSFKKETISKEEVEANITAIKDRFKSYGVYPEITATEYSNDFYFSLKTSADADIIENLLKKPGVVELYEVMPKGDFVKFMLEISTYFDQHEEGVDNPFLNCFTSFGVNSYPETAYVSEEKMFDINMFFKSPEVLSKLESEKGRIRFIYGFKDEEKNAYPLFAIRLSENNRPALFGDFIKQASQTFDHRNEPVIDIQMKKEAFKAWEDLTRKAVEESFQIAIVIDGVVYSAPGVVMPISGGRSSISGNFSLKEAQTLSVILNSNVIPEISVASYGVQGLLP